MHTHTCKNNLGQIDGQAGKGACLSGPEFCLWDPHGRRRESSPRNCPLTSMSMCPSTYPTPHSKWQNFSPCPNGDVEMPQTQYSAITTECSVYSIPPHSYFVVLSKLLILINEEICHLPYYFLWSQVWNSWGGPIAEWQPFDNPGFWMTAL